MLKRTMKTISKNVAPLAFSMACLLLLAVLAPVPPVPDAEIETSVSEEIPSETNLDRQIDPLNDKEPEKVKPK